MVVNVFSASFLGYGVVGTSFHVGYYFPLRTTHFLQNTNNSSLQRNLATYYGGLGGWCAGDGGPYRGDLVGGKF